MRTLLTSCLRHSSSCSARTKSSSAGQVNIPTIPSENKSKERLLQKLTRKHESPSNPIRYAREYGVPRTACFALSSTFRLDRVFPKRRSPRGHATCRDKTRGHRGDTRRKPPPHCSRSCRVTAGARVLGL